VTATEVAAKRLGDDIIPKPTTVWNRGITIAARPSDIWPWLVQMGYGRAGFYVPEWVDRLVWHVPAANSEVLHPEYTRMAVGDIIADGPGYLAYWRVEIVDSEHALVFWTRRHPWRGAPVDSADPAALERREHDLLDGGVYAECSWGFYLDPHGPECTRLLIRTRAVSSPGWLRPRRAANDQTPGGGRSEIGRNQIGRLSLETTALEAAFPRAGLRPNRTQHARGGHPMNIANDVASVADRPNVLEGARTLRVAAVQTPAAESVSAGLERATPLVQRAAMQAAELVLLPELMAVHYVFTEEMWESGEPTNGPTVEWLSDLARSLRIWLGTSFLEATGEDFYNTFVLVGPTGEEAGRVRKQTPAMYEPWFFRGEAGSHVIRTDLGTIGVGICNDNHRSYLPALLQRAGADLVLMPHCWPLPTKASGAISERDIERWHKIQSGLAPLYAKLLGVPAVFVNKVGPYASPAPRNWLPASTGMAFPGHATIADSDGTVRAELGESEGIVTASVTLDPARKTREAPRTYGSYVYPAGVAGLLVLPPAWLFGRAYSVSSERRHRARLVAGRQSASVAV
jgi:N-carbamoylputrescine amidase